jgi:hypothetical protein
MRTRHICRLGLGLLSASLVLWTHAAQAQVSGPPSALCHVTDGTFTTCPNGEQEWSDVTPVAFPASNSFLYVNQDATHTNLYLMYDFPVRTAPLAATDSVHVNFYTVEQVENVPNLITYDVYIYGNGQMSILQQGKPTPAGRIVGAAGYGASPNSSIPHVMAELQVPLSAGPPSTYSPDPLYWSASLPPTPPPPPCPTQPGKSYDDCTKKRAAQAAAAEAALVVVMYRAAALCTAGTIGGCAPEEGAIAIAADLIALEGIYFGYVASDPNHIVFTIPPDSNYTTLAQPATYSLSLPLTGVGAQAAAALTALFDNLEQVIALNQANITSLARAEGASIAGDQTWYTTQSQAAKGFGAQAGILLSSQPQLLANLEAVFQAAGEQFTFTSNDLAAIQTQINPASPTSEIQQEFLLAQSVLGQLGASSSDQALVVQFLMSVDPLSASTLGNGAFPQSLSDPSTATALTDLAGSLITDGPSPTALTTSYNATLAGDYAADGIGLRGNTSGNIALSGIPAGATVVRALLYWSFLDNGEDTSLHQLTMNGTPISGSLIGAGPDTCWGDANSFTYRADVTPYVTGNGTYALTGVASGGAILAEGASLVVVYQLAGAPTKTILIDDGNLSMPYGTSTGTASFGSFTASSPVSATTTFVVGDGQGNEFGPTNVSFTGSLGTLPLSNLFDSNDGPYWDTDPFSVASVVGAGSSTSSAKIIITGDCLLWAAQAFSVATTPVTASPLTATAGVVEAGANGDTVVNLRGLALADAPTLTDQITAIVQFRIIQNPSLSASTLITQLVNGLVNDGVITPSQGAEIQTAVSNQVVQPTQTNTPVKTSVSLSISPSSNLQAGEALTLNVTVTAASGNVIPTGTVTFGSPNTTATVTAPLSGNGTLSYKTTVPAPGTYSLYATYNGSTGFASSVSPTLTQTVTAP